MWRHSQQFWTRPCDVILCNSEPGHVTSFSAYYMYTLQVTIFNGLRTSSTIYFCMDQHLHSKAAVYSNTNKSLNKCHNTWLLLYNYVVFHYVDILRDLKTWRDHLHTIYTGTPNVFLFFSCLQEIQTEVSNRIAAIGWRKDGRGHNLYLLKQMSLFSKANSYIQ